MLESYCSDFRILTELVPHPPSDSDSPSKQPEMAESCHRPDVMRLSPELLYEMATVLTWSDLIAWRGDVFVLFGSWIPQPCSPQMS
jgi:hypothetical protein